MNPQVSSNIPSIGVICEFNPLHNGHVYLLKEARRLVGDTGVMICVMSGRSTQRGECAVVEPFARSRMALSGGADLVIELPFPWCSGGAEAFAMGGVHILSSLGVEQLIFGSECGDIQLLEQGAALISSSAFTRCYAALCREGMGTASAYAQAIRTLAADIPEDFPSSNDLLGLAYLAAIKKLKSNMVPHTIRRLGQDYRDELLTDTAFPSATSLRNLIFEAACDPESLAMMLDGTMPDEALTILLAEIGEEKAPISPAPLTAYAHLYFRLNANPPSDIAETGGGLWAHLHKCAMGASTPEAFFSAAATKQYTNARLRRSMLFAITGVTDADMQALPAYTQLLAANHRGRAYLSALRKSDRAALPVITKPADAPEGRQKALNAQMDSLFTLCLPSAKEAGWLMKKAPYMTE